MSCVPLPWCTSQSSIITCKHDIESATLFACFCNCRHCTHGMTNQAFMQCVVRVAVFLRISCCSKVSFCPLHLGVALHTDRNLNTHRASLHTLQSPWRPRHLIDWQAYHTTHTMPAGGPPEPAPFPTTCFSPAAAHEHAVHAVPRALRCSRNRSPWPRRGSHGDPAAGRC